jgi:1-acyl-sn-glycerol-3-phosphate acyltransferase
MLYSIVRPLARAALFVYFRRIYLSHADRIPLGRPVILACNHPTAFMEPCILACLLDRPLYFLVRGDFFVQPFYARLLRNLHMLPVYRLQDGGYRKLRDNYSTFEACHRALRDNKTILIFAEGNTKYEKRLRPLQKGPGRIAFGALEQYPDTEEIFVVPVGVTYTQVDRFRSEVMIDFAEPLRVRRYAEQFRGNNQEGVNALTAALESGMRRRLVHVERPIDDILVEYLLELDRNDRPAPPLLPNVSADDRPLGRERRIAEAVNRLGVEEKERLRRRTYDYFSRLEKLGVDDRRLRPAPAGPADRLLFALGLLPAAAGYALNYPPLRAARWLADARVPHIEFYAPVMAAAGIPFYLLYFGLLLAAGALGWGREGALLALAAPGLGLLALAYLDALDRYRPSLFRRKVEEARHEELRAQRRALAEEVDRVVGNHSFSSD